MLIREGSYKQLDSVIIENEIIRAEIVPSSGARTASLIYKPENAELLWQNESAEHAPVKYAQNFPEGEKSGFDEMFPTINECVYPDYPWEGTMLPDHGEVWALPWQKEIQPDAAIFTVHGMRLPYSFSKRVRLEDAVLKTVYRLENHSPYSMLFLYAAHPLFNVEPGDRIEVPANLDEFRNAVPSIALPEYGSLHSWSDEFAVMPDQSPDGYKKYYFTGENTEGWCALHRAALGLEIRMSVSAKQLPFLGIWMNEGGWDKQFNLALEPASAPMDDLPAARKFGAESVIAPNEVIEWNLDIQLN
ncbi:MAG: hypothetical protein PQJ61_13410 [Spirochaetales bacterium]|uniref:Galactose mutarotase n=1 Tax=Candidatus Thalassospirochaeta sargassi TaxID=3119039 RepID=A0AAJ1IIN6_9SPIO|nr:hypothetical protein [Spirochaetales bacterium]